jgi:AdoMet-dependent heme synthase
VTAVTAPGGETGQDRSVRGFDDAPFLVIWEVTQACDLACVHCRASAISCRHPQELSAEEGFALLRAIKSFGEPLLVFTGGDPLKRPDLEQLLRFSVGLGLRTTVTPSATPLLTGQAVRMIQRCGVSRMAISLDGPDAVSHDGCVATLKKQQQDRLGRVDRAPSQAATSNSLLMN